MLRLEKRYIDEMVAHARAEDPNECCGILAGKNGRVEKLYRVTNAEHSPYRYLMDPREQRLVMEEADNRGWDLIAFYHSHTHSEAYPSATDVRLAEAWPDQYYIVISLQDKANPAVRAFRIVDGAVTEEVLQIMVG